METIIILFGILVVVVLSTLIVNNKKTDDKINSNQIIPDTEVDVVDSNPIEQGEMPIKPPPINCKYATFLPAPQKYFYVDCCGNKQEGEGFQPWEKRAPVPVDINQEFEGIEILEDEAFQDCK